MSLLKFKRGLKANLPVLNTGETAFTTDTKEVFIGNGSNNTQIPTMNKSNIDITLNSGYSNFDASWKCQLIKWGNFVICQIALRKTDNSPFTAGTSVNIATLPSDFLPLTNFNFMLVGRSPACTVDSSLAYGGNLSLIPEAGCTQIFGSFVYSII